MAAERRELLHALPVRQPGQSGRALQRHRARDPRGARRDLRLRGGARHRRHADGRGPAPEGGARRGRARSSPPSRCRASPCRGCARSTTASSRRSSTSACSTGRSSSPTATRSSGRAGCSTRRASSPASPPARSPRSRCASPNELDEGNVVFIVCDDGWKYLSSGIYTRPVDEIENLDSTVWW